MLIGTAVLPPPLQSQLYWPPQLTIAEPPTGWSLEYAQPPEGAAVARSVGAVPPTMGRVSTVWPFIMPTFASTPSWQLRQKRMTVFASWALVMVPFAGNVTGYLVLLPSPLNANWAPNNGVRFSPHRAYIPFWVSALVPI